VRLWDLRKMRSPDEVRDPHATISYGLRGWDYRNGRYRKPRYVAHPKDCSVMTYRGMRTLRTLIRCAFSPTSTTGGSYIYTGG
jgi:WD repeat-containing protein 23